MQCRIGFSAVDARGNNATAASMDGFDIRRGSLFSRTVAWPGRHLVNADVSESCCVGHRLRVVCRIEPSRTVLLRRHIDAHHAPHSEFEVANVAWCVVCVLVDIGVRSSPLLRQLLFLRACRRFSECVLINL